MDKQLLKGELKKKTVSQIAKEQGVYPNKIRRLAKKLGLEVPDHSKAQALNLSSGNVKHPTEGRERTPEELLKISEGIHQTHKKMSPEQKDKIRKIHKKLWKGLSVKQKRSMMEKSAVAVRRSAKEGSKTEVFLRENIGPCKYHVTTLIPNEKLEIDILVPHLKTIIEVNGISHYEPIHGEEKLDKKKASDKKKYGLLLSKGYCIIVVKHVVKTVSEAYHRNLLKKVKEVLGAIEAKFPPSGSRLIEVNGEE